MNAENLFEKGINPLRYSLFTVLLFFRPALRLALNTIAGISLFCFLFILAFKRNETTPMYAFAGIGLGATSLLWLYDMSISFLAPPGYVLVTQLR